MPIHVELVSPERTVFEGDADLVIARTTTGEIGFQAGHVPFVGVLAIAEARLQMTDGSRQSIAIHRGFVEFANDHLTILSDKAELPADIDVARVQADKQEAEKAIAADSTDSDAADALAKANIRLLVAEKA